MAKEETKEEKPKERFVVGEIATQTAPVILDTETEEQYTEMTALAKILNTLTKVEKALSQ